LNFPELPAAPLRALRVFSYQMHMLGLVGAEMVEAEFSVRGEQRPLESSPGIA
jgi:hypothetical protein